MVLDVTVLIPTYFTGHPKDDAEISDFSKLTIVKSAADSPRVWVSFIFVFLNSVIALFGVYKFWITSVRLTNRRLESVKVVSEKDISHHTLLIHNLDQHLELATA